MELPISCRCGRVTGEVRGAAPATVNRVVCYCDDCQAFARHLGRDDLLDESGGSDIVQVAPATLQVRANEALRCLRLGPKGLYRWYSDCCRTPMGNTVKGVPFVGLHASLFGLDARALDEALGPPRARIQGKFARGTPPPGSTSLQLGPLAKMVGLFLGWKLRGQGRPHPFFDPSSGEPIRTPIVLTRPERDALRPT